MKQDFKNLCEKYKFQYKIPSQVYARCEICGHLESLFYQQGHNDKQLRSFKNRMQFHYNKFHKC